MFPNGYNQVRIEIFHKQFVKQENSFHCVQIGLYQIIINLLSDMIDLSFSSGLCSFWCSTTACESF